MNDKLKEILSVGVCIGLLIGIGCYTGFFNNYGLDDVQKIFNSASSDIKNVNWNLFGASDDKSIHISGSRTSKIGKYRANNIPKNVLKGFQVSGYWNNIFNSKKKVVFYVYDNSGKNTQFAGDFHEKFSNEFNQNNLSNYYNFQPTDYSFFRNYYVGISGHTKICDSIDECKNMHDLSSLKASMQMFLDRCAKYFCIIYPEKQEYILLRNRNPQEAIELLIEAENW